MSVTDELIANAQRQTAMLAKGHMPHLPGKQVAILACMDARLNVYNLLGLTEGEAHVIRNAGGVVTLDALRSLAISQRKLGTREIILIHHTACGMLTFSDDDFRADIEKDTGVKPFWASEAFGDLDTDVRQGIARIRNELSIPHVESVRGFVFDIATGELREVQAQVPGQGKHRQAAGAVPAQSSRAVPMEGGLFRERTPVSH